MDDMKYDIIDLKERGEIAQDEFVGRFKQDNTKLNYYDPIKRQPLALFEKKTTKKKHSIPEDKGQSFTDIFAMYDEKKLDLRKIMDYCVTSKPWASSMPGNNLDVIFDNYSYEYSIPSKWREISLMERVINSLN